MLSGKHFPHNTKALPICVEEILRSILRNESVPDFDDLFTQER